jgi:hypothetical protein
MNCLMAREKVRERAPVPDGPSQPDLCELVDTLRCRGYAVHVNPSCAATRAQVATRAAGFVKSALAVAGNPKSGEAYVRVSGSTKSLLVEVTHLSFSAHDALEHDEAALSALDDLRQEVCSRGEWLTMERGPRGQLRIATLIKARSTDRRGNAERNGDGGG